MPLEPRMSNAPTPSTPAKIPSRLPNLARRCDPRFCPMPFTPWGNPGRPTTRSRERRRGGGNATSFQDPGPRCGGESGPSCGMGLAIGACVFSVYPVSSNQRAVDSTGLMDHTALAPQRDVQEPTRYLAQAEAHDVASSRTRPPRAASYRPRRGQPQPSHRRRGEDDGRTPPGHRKNPTSGEVGRVAPAAHARGLTHYKNPVGTSRPVPTHIHKLHDTTAPT